jgi:hypothetical protein
LSKGTLVHENEYDEETFGKRKYVEMWGQDNNNQDESSYSLRTHMERNENPIYEYDMDAEMESKDT